MSERVHSNPCPCHQQQLRDRRFISAPRRQTLTDSMCAIGFCFAKGSAVCRRGEFVGPLKSEECQKPSQSQKTRRALGGLTTGFVGRSCGGFLVRLVVSRGCVPADFLFSGGGFSGGLFGGFSFVFCDHRKNPPKNPPLPWRPVARLSKVSSNPNRQ